MNIALGTALDYEIWQVDYASAYLNVPNQVPVVMEQAEGYAISEEAFAKIVAERLKIGMVDEGDSMKEGEGRIVALVDTAIYGSMSGAYDWWKVLDKEMKRLGYKRSRADQSVRSRKSREDHTITGTYTDDVSGISSNVIESDRARAELGENFELKDMGDMRLTLGIAVDRDRDAGILTMSQYEYLKRVLEHYNMWDCMPKYTPLPHAVILNKTQAPTSDEDIHFMKDKPYKEVLGSIMYAKIATCPDLSFAVASLSRFASNPRKPHWQALMHVLQYVKATLHYKLRYGGPGFISFTPQGYVDSDYAADTDNRRSISGQVFLQASGPTSWSSKYQPTVAMSTTEAEYIAMSRAVQQLQWMYASLAKVDFPQERPASMFADNSGAISLTLGARNHII